MFPPVELSIMDILYSNEANARDFLNWGVIVDSVFPDFVKFTKKKIPTINRIKIIPTKNPLFITIILGPVFVLFLVRKDGGFLVEKTITPT